MVELNHRERTIKVKIVYYGPPVGGKTTNLQVLHQHAQQGRRGELISINSAQDRTILFDLLPLKAAGFRGFDLRLQVLAVPGQAMYAATRRLVLKGADALVFVANSASDRWEENIQSFREMTQNLLVNQLDPSGLPLVFQYNKRDLPQVTGVEIMDRALNARSVDAIPAVAVRGEGVLETFSAILLRTMQDLSSRYQIVDTGKGQTIQQWVRQTITGMFGTTALAVEPNPAPAEPHPELSAAAAFESPAAPAAPTAERRTVRVTLPEDLVRRGEGLGPDARADETLVESYAQASSQLGGALEGMREERDSARRRLEDMQQALVAAQDVLVGQPLEPTLRSVLGRLAQSAGAAYASILCPDAGGLLRAAALLDLDEDPLLRVPSGVRHVSTRFLKEAEPRVHQTADNLDLGDALEANDPPLAAVVAVPVRTPGGLQALAMLYYDADAALPGAEALAHLGQMARALSASLELVRVLETVKNAERSLSLAVAGTASVRGLEEVTASLNELRDRLGAMRRRPDAPGWFVAEFAQLAPSLSSALSTARSLLAFSRGEIQREPVGVEELMAHLSGHEVVIEMAPGVGPVSGDAALLRLALAALVDQARSGGDRVPLAVRAVSQGGRVSISVSGEGLSMPAGQAAADMGLNLVRRIAELHGGSLTQEAQGRGSRFVLHLNPA
jgi:signal recognition particle receptor subunit beta/signal transduction histidine kinase